MSRDLFVTVVVSVAVSFAATMLIINFRDSCKPALTKEQQAARERFFGPSNELPPIKKGQEMRPRW